MHTVFRLHPITTLLRTSYLRNFFTLSGRRQCPIKISTCQQHSSTPWLPANLRRCQILTPSRTESDAHFPPALTAHLAQVHQMLSYNGQDQTVASYLESNNRLRDCFFWGHQQWRSAFSWYPLGGSTKISMMQIKRSLHKRSLSANPDVIRTLKLVLFPISNTQPVTVSYTHLLPRTTRILQISCK